MKIIQTFWTAGQDPLKHSFGWTHPEYNLMSWALSCLSLMEHYDDVELYTDSAENLSTASYDISQSRTCNLEVGLFKIVDGQPPYFRTKKCKIRC